MFIYNKLRWLLFFLRHRNKAVRIKFSSIVNSGSICEGSNKLYDNVNIKGTVVGLGSYIGPNSQILNSTIGRFCSIGNDVHVIIGRHPVNEFTSTHPAFFSTKCQAGFTFVNESMYCEHNYADKKNRKSVLIGNDVWLGAHAKILEGVTIGDGAIIAAGSIVTKNVEPYAIYAGVPAKKIKFRFSIEKIEYLLSEPWWLKSIEEIRNQSGSFKIISKEEHIDGV